MSESATEVESHAFPNIDIRFVKEFTDWAATRGLFNEDTFEEIYQAAAMFIAYKHNLTQQEVLKGIYA